MSQIKVKSGLKKSRTRVSKRMEPSFENGWRERFDPATDDGDVRVPYVKGMLLRGDCPCDIRKWYSISDEEINTIADGSRYRYVEAAPFENLPGYEAPTPPVTPLSVVDFDYLLAKLSNAKNQIEAIESELREYLSK
jgi:hypothetical protein